MTIDKNQKNLLKAYNMLLYFAGSMIMKEPTEECVIDFWANGTLKRLPVQSSNPRFIKAASILRESCEDKVLCRSMLRADFSRLFDKNGLYLSPALESAYINKITSPVRNSETAGDFYRAYGWIPESSHNVPDDHLSTELIFLTRLVEKCIDIDDEPSCREMKGEIRRFIDQHILQWISVWDESVQQNAGTLCYKGISTLIYACTEDIYSLLS